MTKTPPGERHPLTETPWIETLRQRRPGQRLPDRNPLDREPLDKDPRTDTLLCRESPGQRLPCTETMPWGMKPPWTDWDPPAVERQTPVKTLPSQTSFAGGKYYCNWPWMSNVEIDSVSHTPNNDLSSKSEIGYSVEEDIGIDLKIKHIIQTRMYTRMRTVVGGVCQGGSWVLVCARVVDVPRGVFQNDRHVQKHYLVATTLWTVTMPIHEGEDNNIFTRFYHFLCPNLELDPQ